MRVTHLILSCTTLVLAVLSPVEATSSCSAKCTGCSGPSPSCQTGSLCEVSLCQGGQCGGHNVGCCCSVGGAWTCVDTSCGFGKLDPQYPGGRTGGTEWAVVEYTVDDTGKIVAGPSTPFASSSAHAATVTSEFRAPGEQTEEPAGTYFRLVLESPPFPVPPADVRWLEDRLQSLELDPQSETRFAVRVSGRQVEVLFSTDPSVSDLAVDAFVTEPGQRPIDGVYLIEVLAGRIGVVHSR